MKPGAEFIIQPQPTETTCGPTCLQGVYQFYGDDIDLTSVIREVKTLKTGGTLAALLGAHALKRGYQASLYSYDLQIFDPTWEKLSQKKLAQKLAMSFEAQKKSKLKLAINSHLEFLKLGGKILFDELSPELLISFFKNQKPVLAGLSSTYLYRAKREYETDCTEDDVRGQSCGHFVVLYEYTKTGDRVRLADPWKKHPYGKSLVYEVPMQRLINSIMLGVLTYDANILVLSPPVSRRRSARIP